MSTIHVVCAHCHARNRVPAERLDAQPRCGACKQPVFSASPVSIDSTADFDRHVAGSDIPVVVDFWADWCGPCKAIAPHFSAAAAGVEPALRLLKVNVDEQPELAARYGIRSIPTLVAFRNGTETGRQAGAPAPAQLRAWLAQWQRPS